MKIFRASLNENDLSEKNLSLTLEYSSDGESIQFQTAIILMIVLTLPLEDGSSSELEGVSHIKVNLNQLNSGGDSEFINQLFLVSIHLMNLFP